MQRCGRGEGQSMRWCDRKTYRPLTGRLAITLRSLTANTGCRHSLTDALLPTNSRLFSLRTESGNHESDETCELGRQLAFRQIDKMHGIYRRRRVDKQSDQSSGGNILLY